MLSEVEIDAADAALSEAVRRGDPGALDQLVERHGDRVYRVARLVSGSDDDAVDVARESLREAVAAIEAGACGPLGSLIARIAGETAYRTVRPRSPRVGAPSAPTAQILTPVDDWTKNGAPGPADLSGLMAGAIDGLPLEDRVALVLHDVEGLPRADVAAVLGIDARAVAARVHRARLLARARLSRRLVQPEA